MSKYLKYSLFGLLTWVVPFVASFFFFDPETGQTTVDIFLFKSIMILISALLGAYILVKLFKKITDNFIQEAVIISVIWLGINYLLDIVVLLPMSGMAFGQWFIEIGIRYLMIPIWAIAIGYAAKR